MMKSLRTLNHSGVVYSSVKQIQGVFKLLRLRYTGQVVGIVTVLSLKSVGFTLQAVLVITATLLLSIATFMFDDAHDESSDRIVHIQRPIPQGVFRVRQVYIMGTLALVASICCAMFLWNYQTLVFLTAVMLSLAVIFLQFPPSIKAILSSASIFLLFPFSADLTSKTLFFGMTVTLPHIAGSITKDVLHLSGDQHLGLLSPSPWAIPLASSLFALSAGVLVLPTIIQLVPVTYLIVILPAVGSSIMLSYKVLKKQYQKVYIFGGIAMVSTLLAIALFI